LKKNIENIEKLQMWPKIQALGYQGSV